MTQGATAPLFAVEGLRTWFQSNGGYRRAVENVGFSVERGRALGVVGESGSGKTQTFFSIFGMTHGSPGVIAGRARFDDTELLDELHRHVEIREANGRPAEVRKASSTWERRHRRALEPILGRQVTMVFQEPRRSLIPYWTVGKHLNAVLHRAARPASEAGDLLGRLGIRNVSRLLSSYPASLSGGEAQRVMLALATASRPRMLIADEPTTALDAVSQLRILEELERVHGELGLSLVLISHDLAVVRALVDSVIVLFSGRVVERMSVSVLDMAGSDELHPYTGELWESQRRRAAGAAIVPRRQVAEAASTGCPYQHRCPRRARLAPEVQARCRSEVPPMVTIGPGHDVACWAVVS